MSTSVLNAIVFDQYCFRSHLFHLRLLSTINIDSFPYWKLCFDQFRYFGWVERAPVLNSFDSSCSIRPSLWRRYLHHPHQVVAVIISTPLLLRSSDARPSTRRRRWRHLSVTSCHCGLQEWRWRRRWRWRWRYHCGRGTG